MEPDPIPEVVPEPIPEVVPEPIPETVSMDDIINDHATVVQREFDTNAFLTAQLISVNPSSLRSKLLEWAMLKYPAIFPILNFPVDVPEMCADGVSRTILPFVEYCLGMPVSAVLVLLSAKLPGMDVSYSYSGSSFSIHVSKL